MCQSIAEGGQRCAAHTRPKYLDAMSYALSDSLPNYSSGGVNWPGYTPSVVSNLMDSALDHASTPSGNVDVLKDIDKYKNESDFAMLVGILEVAQLKGLEKLEAQKSIKAQIENLIREPDSSKALAIASALGAEVPAPVGSSFYQVTHTTYYQDDSSVDILGAWSTEELAKQGVADWIVRRWFDLGLNAPWHHDHPEGRDFYRDLESDENLWVKAKENFLNGKSNDEIIKVFSEERMSGKVEIKKLKVT